MKATVLKIIRSGFEGNRTNLKEYTEMLSREVEKSGDEKFAKVLIKYANQNFGNAVIPMNSECCARSNFALYEEKEGFEVQSRHKNVLPFEWKQYVIFPTKNLAVEWLSQPFISDEEYKVRSCIYRYSKCCGFRTVIDDQEFVTPSEFINSN